MAKELLPNSMRAQEIEGLANIFYGANLGTGAPEDKVDFLRKLQRASEGDPLKSIPLSSLYRDTDLSRYVVIFDTENSVYLILLPSPNGEGHELHVRGDRELVKSTVELLREKRYPAQEY